MVCSIVFSLISIIDLRCVLGKVYPKARMEVIGVISFFRYYAGWADKVQGKTLEVSTNMSAFQTALENNLALRHVLNIRDRPMRINLLTRGMNHMASWYAH